MAGSPSRTSTAVLADSGLADPGLADSAPPAAEPTPGADVRSIRDRLVVPMPGSPVWGWAGPLFVTAIAGFFHFWRLGVPGSIVFDETYYVHDANNLLSHGVELNSDNTGPGYVVHPPLGKWMMAFGQWLFHTHVHHGAKGLVYTGAFGWRFSSAVVGTLAVLILARTARRMTRSTTLGCVAGLLLTLDGLEFVESRMALLDIFLMFWVVAAFGCLVRDRDDVRERLARLVDTSPEAPVGYRPLTGTGPRWWLVGAGVCVGAATAVKWDGVWYIPTLALLALGWEVGARRTAGGRPWARSVWDAAWYLGAGGFALLPVILFHHTWVWSVCSFAVLALLWETVPVRHPGTPARGALLRSSWWFVGAAAALYGAFRLFHYHDQVLGADGSVVRTIPVHMHWAWWGVALVIVAIAYAVGSRAPGPVRRLPALLRSRGWQVPVAMGVVPVAVYVASWSGWFFNSTNAYNHDAFTHPGQGWLSHVHAVVKGWLDYHHGAYVFHDHLDASHPYASRPFSWLVLGRPVAYYYANQVRGQNGCHADSCAREVLAIGTPLIWWVSIAAVLVVLWFWVSRRDWRAAGTLVMFAAGYLPWFFFAGYIPGGGVCNPGHPCQSRTMFLFYALPMLPFMVLALTLTLGLVLGRSDASPTRRLWGASAAGAYVLLVALNFMLFYPLLAAQSIPMSQWQQRIWFPSWI